MPARSSAGMASSPAAGSRGVGELAQAQAGVTWQTASRWERASPEYPHLPTSASPQTMSQLEEIAGLAMFPDGFHGFTQKCYVWIDHWAKIPTRGEFGYPWGTALRTWDNEGPTNLPDSRCEVFVERGISVVAWVSLLPSSVTAAKSHSPRGARD